MPPKVKITRDMILDAAFRLVREEGHQALTARRLAAALGCSTQPILYQFSSVDEIVRETYQRADEYHTRYLTDGLENEEVPLLALGLRYIRFGAEEKPLFRFLFQSGHFSGDLVADMAGSPDALRMAGMVAQASGLDPDAALKVFRALFTSVHGYASLLANNAMDWQSAQAEEILTMLLEGLSK